MRYDYDWLLCEVPDGWIKAFGHELVDELMSAAESENLEDFTILQIKEKYGALRVYCMPTTEKIEEIIDKYTDLSEKTCCVCGAPSTHFSTGWICPYCDECVPT